MRVTLLLCSFHSCVRRSGPSAGLRPGGAAAAVLRGQLQPRGPHQRRSPPVDRRLVGRLHHLRAAAPAAGFPLPGLPPRAGAGEASPAGEQDKGAAAERG